MITTEFLHDVAVYANGRVKKVVLNGSYEIADFEIKQVNENILSMKYMVPFGSVEAISKIELQGTAGEVISTNEVAVPITTDTLLLQTLKVKEG